jgi:non-homologous end joining protein Ku
MDREEMSRDEIENEIDEMIGEGSSNNYVALHREEEKMHKAKVLDAFDALRARLATTDEPEQDEERNEPCDT